MDPKICRYLALMDGKYLFKISLLKSIFWAYLAANGLRKNWDNI